MSRAERSVHRMGFEQPLDFNQQMYEALRAAPWWMISIAFHVLVVVLSSMFQTEVVKTVQAPPLVANFDHVDAPDVDRPDDPVEPTEKLTPSDLDAKVPFVKNLELSDHFETDDDAPYEESKLADGTSIGSFDGPSTNTLIGTGGSSGSRFGLGRGGWRNLGGDGASSRRKLENAAVEDALKWLAAHQSPDGGWEAEGYRRWCDGKPASGEGLEGVGKATYDVGVTGFSLLAFLGAGYTNRSEGAFGKVVSNGLKYLRNVQDAEGCFGARASGHYVYNHAIASLAMVEAYGMTGSAIYRAPAQKALDFIAIARNPYFAWRYGVKPGDNDTSVTGWMMMALKSAKLIVAADVKGGRSPSLVFDEDAFEGIKAWVDKMTDPDTGRVGYQQRGTGPARPQELVDRFPSEKSESMTAVGVLARVFLGESVKTSDAIQKGAGLCAKLLPTWNPNDGSIDMYYWYYATLAMFQVGGEPWKKWEAAMKPAIVDTQRRDGEYCLNKGSWDPIDAWGGDGGRVYSTAAMALCLEVWYRYERVSGTK